MAPPENVVDDRVVYMAFNGIFQGQSSQIRKLPAIKKLVHKHQKEAEVAQLLKEYGAPVICEKLQKLLGSQVFESTLKAKGEFPQLFEVSRAQSVERAISEVQAAAGHAKAVEKAIASADHYGLQYGNDYDSGRNPHVTESINLRTEQQSSGPAIRVPSLFPLEFNFITAYKILVKTQEILELACFRFARKVMPEILEQRNWHYPESTELNIWAIEFLKRLRWFEKRPYREFSPSRPLKELFPSIAQIRHHAVHRIPVTAKELEDFLADGETIAQLFEDHTTIAVMSRVRSEVHKAAAEMENRKNLLETRLTKILQHVAERRADLDRIEAEAIADAQRKDKENQFFTGARLQETIWSEDGAFGERVFTTQSLAASVADNESFLNELNPVLESDMASYKDSKTDDTLKTEPIPTILGTDLVGDSDGDSAADEFEDALAECVRPSNSSGDELEVEKAELSSYGSANHILMKF